MVWIIAQMATTTTAMQPALIATGAALAATAAFYGLRAAYRHYRSRNGKAAR